MLAEQVLSQILTSAWDEIDFQQNYLNLFNNYASDPEKTVCVVLMTSEDLSVQYFNI